MIRMKIVKLILIVLKKEKNVTNKIAWDILKNPKQSIHVDKMKSKNGCWILSALIDYQGLTKKKIK